MQDRPLAHRAGQEGDTPLAYDATRSTFESLLNTLPLSVLIKGPDSSRLFANQSYLDVRGLALDELLGKRNEDLHPPEIARQITEDDQRVMRERISLRNFEETLDSDGSRRCFERIKSPIFRTGEVVGVQLLFWDITEQKKVEEELLQERALLRTLLAHIPDWIFFKDRDSQFIRVSDAMAERFKFPDADAVIGKKYGDFIDKEVADATRRDEVEIMETRIPMVDHLRHVQASTGGEFWYLSTKMPLVDQDDNVIGTFGITRDVTELKKSEQQLREARDAAEQASRAKSDFLANMSHEIRTPMNAIIGITELMSKMDMSEELRDRLQLVRDSADSLMGLLNSVLDLSKIEARKLELESVRFSLRDLLEKTARSLSLRAAEKNLELACRVATDVPDRWIGDAGRLRQIVTNLIGNGIKFTDEGEVVVDVSQGDALRDPDSPNTVLQFTVRDTGIGIPEDKQAMVLESFTQADASTTRRFGGTGLGLNIAKQLVELMNGELAVESQVGVGTTFRFTVQLTRDAMPIPATDDKIDGLEDLKVLVVDDNQTNRHILTEILSTWNLLPSAVADGPTALEAIDAAAQSGEPFPLVITDCMMPGMDGFELCRRIREQFTTDQMKLIVLSSATRGGEERLCAEFGIARHLTKPIVQSELRDVLLQVIADEGGNVEGEKEETPACPSLRVLVAEDGIANQHVAIGLLRSFGHESVVVSDGREAVARWQSEPFDAILMDVHMPIMDGVEATRYIRTVEQETNKHVPIIALTAAVMKEDTDACRAAGMDDYLSKPIIPRKLQETLAKYAPETPALAAAGEERNSEATDALSDSALGMLLAGDSGVAISESVDLRAAATRTPGGLAAVRRLTEVFIPECESLMQTLNQELPDGDRTVIRRAAHTLKGSAKLFHAEDVTQEAAEIEHLAREDDLPAAARRLASLNAKVELMLQALHRFLELRQG